MLLKNVLDDIVYFKKLFSILIIDGRGKVIEKSILSNVDVPLGLKGLKYTHAIVNDIKEISIAC